MTLAIDVLTIFPEMFPGPLAFGLVGKAFAAGRATLRTINPRDYATDKHQKVDDVPYGGGAGLVMKYEPLFGAITEARRRGRGPCVMLTPQGRPLTQADLERWSKGEHLVLVAGRYEGFDERVLSLVDEEISLGDFVLTGGELPAATIIDGVVRLLPGTLGNADSSTHDSFQRGLLEHPHYTRPPKLEVGEVPEVLTSGHHAQIEAWRHARSLQRTLERRPDLLLSGGLPPEDWAALRAMGLNLEVWLELGGSPAPSLLGALDGVRRALGVDRVRLLGPGLDGLEMPGFAVSPSLDEARAGLPKARIVATLVPPPAVDGLVRRAFVVFA